MVEEERVFPARFSAGALDDQGGDAGPGERGPGALAQAGGAGGRRVRRERHDRGVAAVDVDLEDVALVVVRRPGLPVT
jgi:hypothetical protein